MNERIKWLLNDYQTKILQRSINILNGLPFDSTVTYQLLPSEVNAVMCRAFKYPKNLTGTHYYLLRLD